jgi:hypothetical protein
MKLAPANAADRIRTILTGDRSAAPQTLEALISETLDLVERNMPEVDTRKTRSILQIEVQACENPPRIISEAER